MDPINPLTPPSPDALPETDAPAPCAAPVTPEPSAAELAYRHLYDGMEGVRARGCAAAPYAQSVIDTLLWHESKPTLDDIAEGVLAVEPRDDWERELQDAILMLCVEKPKA